MSDKYIPSGENLWSELQRISVVLNNVGTPDQLAAAPEFPQPNQLVVADGVNWDPLGKATGNTYMVRYDADNQVWQEIGSSDVDLTDYYTKGELDALLTDKASTGSVTTIGDALSDAVQDIVNLQTSVDTVNDLVADQSTDIANLLTTYGDTAAAAASAIAAAASESAAAAELANAIIAAAGADASKDDAIAAQVAAESARDDAGASASAAGSSAASAATAATDAGTAATAALVSEVNATSAANAAINAAQGGVTVDGAPGAVYLFNASVDGWSGATPSISWDSSGFIHQGTGTDPHLTSPAMTVAGGSYADVAMRIRRNAGTGWEGRLRWSTSGHGFGSGHELVLTAPLFVNGEWQVISWGLGGISDWAGNTITALEIQIGADSGTADFDIDWIAVGNNLATLAQAAAASASSAATSATNAGASATAAHTDSLSAASSDASAGTSASAAATSASSASSSATSAGSSASAANTSKIAAQTSETNAAGSASTAVMAASGAATSATSATNSAALANTKAIAAATSATNAAVSETAAGVSATAAHGSELTATTKASEAVVSAASAATSKTGADTSASAAAASATQATTGASSASTFAGQASNSSLAAANAASNASTAASQAASSAATATTQASSATTASSQASASASLAAQAAGTLTAVNPLNNGTTVRWTGLTGAGQANISGRLRNFGYMDSTGDSPIDSDPFQIEPTAIYEVRFSYIKVTANDGQDLVYVGALANGTVGTLQGINNQVIVNAPTVGPYWLYDYNSDDGWKDAVVYLLGSNANISKCPDGLFPSGAVNYYGSGLQCVDPANVVRIRFLNWNNRGTGRRLLITDVSVSRIDNMASAELKTESQVRATAVSSLASQQTSLSATVNGLSVSVSQLFSASATQGAQWVLSLTTNNYVAGIRLANNGAGQSSVVFLVDSFAIAQNSASGPVFPFTIGSINGVATVSINGNLVVDGTISGRAISAGGVGTSNVAPSAITNATGVQTSGGILSSTIVASVGISTIGGAVQVLAQATVSVTTGAAPVTASLRRNGGILRSITKSVTAALSPVDFTFAFLDAPPAIANTWDVQISGNSSIHHETSLSAVEYKR